VDSNGTRYHLLLGFDDWSECTDGRRVTLRDRWKAAAQGAIPSPPTDAPPVAWNAENYELTLQPRLFKFKAARHDVPPAFERRRGGGRDRYGNWYWIDETKHAIRVNSAGTNKTSLFWPVEGSGACAAEAAPVDFTFAADVSCPALTLSALAVTEDHYLVVGVSEPSAGVLVFDLHAGGAPQGLWWPKGVPFAPHDMAPRAGGGVFILDGQNKRYWELDRLFNVVPPESYAPVSPGAEDFKAKDSKETNETLACELPQRLTLETSTRIHLARPISIEALPDNSILVLDYRADKKFSRIHRYRAGKRLGQSRSTKSMLKLIEQEKLAEFSLVGYDFAFVPRREATGEPDRLYIVAADGNQSYAFNIKWYKRAQIKLEPVAAYLPMRLFGGKGLARAGIDAYYDFDERWIPLVEQPRPRYAESGTFETRAFDGAEPDCVWHRLMLDACIPPGTSVEVRSRAANNEDDLALAEWSREPGLYLRGDGTELAYAGGTGSRRGVAASSLRAEGRGTWELLFQRARGRFMQLQITLGGNERSSPRLSALRAYYPRFSYLVRYLPSVYREDDQSASFLERFLANLEGMYTSLEDKIAAVQVLFDVRSAPADALEWLAGWYGVALDPVWTEAKRRQFIKHAMFFFQYRGTMHGLELALRLATDECVEDEAFTEGAARRAANSGAYSIRVVEKFRTRRVPGVVFGDPTEAFAPRLVAQAARWQPSRGSAALHALYREQLGLAAAETYPVMRPAGNAGKAWEAFSQAALGFAPAATAGDASAWADFLARRYRHLAALQSVYKTQPASFADVELPRVLPDGGEALNDWYQFESVVVAMRRTAHAFTVLLPMRQTDSFDTAEHRTRRALAARIVELEKPAHTTFDVRFYWAMFRVGEVRLGDDSLLDLGSRAPGLMRPMLLGEEHLAESYLAPAHPQNVAERNVLGRR
jgi:phage tail-like protein